MTAQFLFVAVEPSKVETNGHTEDLPTAKKNSDEQQNILQTNHQLPHDWIETLLLFDTPSLKQQVFCTPVASIKFWTPQHHVLSCWKWPHCDFKMSCLPWIHTKFSCISHLSCCPLVFLTTHQAHLSRWHLPRLLLTYGRPECWAPLFPRSPSYPHASNNETQKCAAPSRWVNTSSRIWWFIILEFKQILSYSLHTNDRFLISSFNKVEFWE